jgi:flagella synthesis protein FlgN
MSRALLAHLASEREAIDQFVEVLDQEAEAMTCGAFASLGTLAERKSKLVDAIAVLDRLREAEQRALGFSADRKGADAAVAGNAAMQTIWQDLCKRAAQAHERNHRNGVMIHAHLDFIWQSIRFLQAGSQPMYGRDGIRHCGTGSGNRIAIG